MLLPHDLCTGNMGCNEAGQFILVGCVSLLHHVRVLGLKVGQLLCLLQLKGGKLLLV